MKHQPRSSRRALGLTLGLLALTAQARAQQATTVRLGFSPNLTHAPALIGLERGLFQKALGRVRLDARQFVSGITLTEAFAAGRIDIAYIGPGPAITAATRGMPVQFLAGSSEAGAVLVARKDTPIRSYRDLDNRIVAVPGLGNTQDITLRRLLTELGLKSRADGGTVTIVPIPPADTIATFEGRRADATLVPEPWGAALEARGHRVIGSEKTIWRGGRYPTTVVIANARFAQANPELVANFLKAHASAVTFLVTSPVAAQRAVNAQLNTLTGEELDARVLRRAYARIRFTTALDAGVLREYAALNMAVGYARNVPDLALHMRR